jgi:acetyl esterase/lipase
MSNGIESTDLKFKGIVEITRQVLKNSVGQPIGVLRAKSDTILDSPNIGIFPISVPIPIHFRQLAHKILKNYCLKVYKEYPGIEVDYHKIEPLNLKLYNYGENFSKIVYYIHGGGWFFRRPESYSALMKDLSKESHSNIASIDYRLIPENSVFESLEDSLAGYLFLTGDLVNLGKGYKASDIVIGGDSAGGGLVAQVVHFLRNISLDLPAATILWSPNLDLTSSQPSEYIMEDKDYIPGPLSNPITKGDLTIKTKFWAIPYLGANEKDKRKMELEGSVFGPKRSTYWPLLSPMLDPDLNGLPPILLVNSDNDSFRDSGLVYARRLFEQQRNQKGVFPQLTAHIYEDMPHDFTSIPFAPPREQSITRASNFIKFAHNPQQPINPPYTIQDHITASKFGKVPELSKDRFEAYYLTLNNLPKPFDPPYKINPYELWNWKGVNYMVNFTSLLA